MRKRVKHFFSSIWRRLGRMRHRGSKAKTPKEDQTQKEVKEGQVGSKEKTKQDSVRSAKSSRRALRRKKSSQTSSKRASVRRKSSSQTSSKREKSQWSAEKEEPTQISRRGAADDSDKSERSIGPSQGRLRDISGRVSRRMKTFASRPIRDVALKGFIGKVKAKQDADRTSTREVNRGDDLYPHERVVKALSRERGVKEVFSKKWISEDSTQLPSTSYAEEKDLLDGHRSDERAPGALFVRGQPFWIDPDTQSPFATDNTEAELDLPLNGDALLEVERGTIELVPMPNTPVILDPYARLSSLKKRDNRFFSRSVVFGNSIRSMINLSDNASVRIQRHQRKPTKILVWEPTQRFLYVREKCSQFTEFPFEPGCASAEKDDNQLKKLMSQVVTEEE
uniref:Uncharacterized protein n=1 Tax=Haemonchus contortus TaxID=6289 RepID=A0A7I4YT09_HAECO|nr:hypothetical protein HCOI_01277500 [Haemonchus contortus]